MYTGNSSSSETPEGGLPVYPCVYRELGCDLLNCFIKNGLSLCIQGTLAVFEVGDDGWRFIPVYTGNSGSGRALVYDSAVYPCVYRELEYLVDH